MTTIFLVTTEWAAPGMVPVHEKGREFPEGFEAHITLIGRGQSARTPRSVACCATQRNRNVLLRKGPQCVMQRSSSSLNLSDTLPLVALVMADVWHSRGCLGRCRRQPSVSHPSSMASAISLAGALETTMRSLSPTKPESRVRIQTDRSRSAEGFRRMW